VRPPGPPGRPLFAGASRRGSRRPAFDWLHIMAAGSEIAPVRTAVGKCALGGGRPLGVGNLAARRPWRLAEPAGLDRVRATLLRGAPRRQAASYLSAAIGARRIPRSRR